jgi:hypothetical protein
MTAGVTNTPQSEEELQEALEKARVADEREQQAHEAARSGKPSPEDLQRHERIASATHAQMTAMWEQATAAGTLTHHINAVLFTAAVIVANAKTHGEQVRIIEYISKTASGMKENMSKAQPHGVLNS